MCIAVLQELSCASWQHTNLATLWRAVAMMHGNVLLGEWLKQHTESAASCMQAKMTTSLTGTRHLVVQLHCLCHVGMPLGRAGTL